MGYTTDFTGHLDITPPLKPAHVTYLQKFNQTRRMKRDAAITSTRPDPVREAVKLKIGPEGGYYVGAPGAPGITDYNRAPADQPGLWCGWTVSDDGKRLEWDGGEKFDSYVDWLQYLIAHFLAPWKYKLNGNIEWAGEEREDLGFIIVKDNKVSTKTGRVTYTTRPAAPAAVDVTPRTGARALAR